MTYQEAIDFLFPLHRFGMKPGLENIQLLCRKLGHPERRLGEVIQVAGTNGKGSTAAFMSSISHEAGAKTALYTSPHIEHFSERIRIDGVPISEEAIASYCSDLKPIAEEIGATFFEVTTAIALKYFSESRVDRSVIEVGMGGRLDATNVLNPKYVLITPIDLDHQEWLGESIERIAIEKAGIIKQGSQTYSSIQHIDALEVLNRTAREKRSRFTLAPMISRFEIASTELGELKVHLHTEKRSYYGLKSPLWGTYQVENLRLAVLVAEKIGFSEAAIRNGILKVIENTGHHGRLEVVSKNPFTILDVSHNPHGMASSVKSLQNHRSEFEKVFTVFGVMSDKEVKPMMESLATITNQFFLCAPQLDRAMNVEALAKICSEMGIASESFASVKDAVNAAKSVAGEKDLILITGSFYVAGEAMEIVKSLAVV